jgi:hypothetical protein
MNGEIDRMQRNERDGVRAVDSSVEYHFQDSKPARFLFIAIFTAQNGILIMMAPRK